MRFCIFLVILYFLVACSNTHEPSTAQETSQDSILPVQEIFVHHDQAALRTLVWEASGTPVVMHAALGRPADDLRQLGTALQRAGYKAIAMEMRGAGKSTGVRPELTPRVYLEDVNAVIDSLANDAPVFLLGWSEGNRIMRFFSAVYPNKTKANILFAFVGDKINPTDIHLHSAMTKVFDDKLPAEERTRAISWLFFAHGHKPSAWDSGWSQKSAKAFIEACELKEAEIHDYETGGVKPMLIVTGGEDKISPPQAVYEFVARREPTPEVIVLPHAGHALLIEQPEVCADTLVSFLKSIP